MSMHLSPHDCDLLCAGLLGPDQATPLREHAAGCPDCAARLADAEAARAAFLVKNPPPARARALLDEVGRPRPRRWWWLPAMGSAVAAAAVLLLLFRPSPPETRLKGGALSCRLMRGGEVLVLVEAGHTAEARAGDVLRCTFDGNVEVFGDGKQRVYRGSGPAEQSFAISGTGGQRLTFHWSDGREQWIGVMVR
jgi:hypothetical protein